MHDWAQLSPEKDVVNYFLELHARHQVIGQVGQTTLGNRSDISDRSDAHGLHRIGHESKNMLDYRPDH